MTKDEAEKTAREILYSYFSEDRVAEKYPRLISMFSEALLEASKLGHVGDDDIEKEAWSEVHSVHYIDKEIDNFHRYFVLGAKWYRSKITEDK